MIQHNRIKNPNWQKATRWLFTSEAANLNSGRPSTNIIQQVARAGLEPGTAGLRVRRADHSATLPPSLSVHTLQWRLLIVRFMFCVAKINNLGKNNNSQHCWMLRVASVCTPCYMLLRVIASVCTPLPTRTQQATY